jgi:predicted PurR-regulated permease PerM
MITSEKKFPFYLKAVSVLVFLYLLFYIIHIGASILVPLGFSFLFAVLLRPIESFLIRKKVPKILAIVIALVLFIVVFLGIILFISGQMSSLSAEAPALKKSMEGLLHSAQRWLSQTFNVSFVKQAQMIEDAKNNSFNALAPGTLNLLSASIATSFLIPVYMFLFLLYRELFLRFITALFTDEHHKKVTSCIMNVKDVVRHFITGVMIETSIVAALNVVGLLIIGAPYAILLGIVGAIMNTIPYIGGIIQLVLSALIVFANTGSATSMVATLAVLLLVQMIDNYFLVPRIIGSKVKLNALISIVGVLLGGAIAGIGGMFLSIPFLAITKVIFEQVDDLKPWAMLLGGDVPIKKSKIGQKIQNKLNRK